jgi:hypothetical protein
VGTLAFPERTFVPAVDTHAPSERTHAVLVRAHALSVGAFGDCECALAERGGLNWLVGRGMSENSAALQIGRVFRPAFQRIAER